MKLMWRKEAKNELEQVVIFALMVIVAWKLTDVVVSVVQHLFIN